MEEKLEFDVIIIGSGLSGIYTALSLDEKMQIAIISNGSIEETNSFLAQGGVAAPVGINDTPESHFNDTMRCGHNVNDPAAVKQLTECAKDEIDQLIRFGVEFDLNQDGSFQFGMEGAHSCPRILRIGDYTGKAIMETLWQRIIERKNITVLDNAIVYELHDAADTDTAADTDAVKRVALLVGDQPRMMFARTLVIATGGMGRLYMRTSNNQNITGDGIALAIKSGIEVKHLNWIQFHPTVYYNITGLQKGFLISEAVRGEGAFLLNAREERFMTKYHEMLELAPRDVVSSAILLELKQQELPYVWLDVRQIGSETMKMRFPTIYAYCMEQGLNLDTDLIPVAPGAHYAMGGIAVDLNGKTSKENVYAIGECSYTGVHGKNRLASNSLLEAIVFAKKTAKDIMWMNQKYEKVVQIHSDTNSNNKIPHYDVEMKALSVWMDKNMGIEKNYTEITKMKNQLEEMMHSPKSFTHINIEDIKKNNALIVMKEMIVHALREYEDDK